MLKMGSHAFIPQQLNLHNKVWLIDLDLQIGGSNNITKRVLQQLVNKGEIINRHGGPFSLISLRASHFKGSSRIYTEENYCSKWRVA